jgi:hypothetical protein
LTLEIEVTDQFLTSPDGKSPTFKRLVKPCSPAVGAREPTLTTR